MQLVCVKVLHQRERWSTFFSLQNLFHMKAEQLKYDNSYLKIGISGNKKTGKSKGVLLLAKGLAQNQKEIFHIDTELNSTYMQAELGAYSILTIKPPFLPDKFTEAILFAIDTGAKIVVIDCLSQVWVGMNNLLKSDAEQSIFPMYLKLLKIIKESHVHIVSSIKQEHLEITPQLSEEYYPFDFTILFELNIRFLAQCVVDNTGLFLNSKQIYLTESIGEEIGEWHKHQVKQFNMKRQIESCQDLNQLRKVYLEAEQLTFEEKNYLLSKIYKLTIG